MGGEKFRQDRLGFFESKRSISIVSSGKSIPNLFKDLLYRYFLPEISVATKYDSRSNSMLVEKFW